MNARHTNTLTMGDLAQDGPPVSPRELADVLGVSRSYVRKLVRAGVLPAVRLPNAGASGRRDLGRLRISRDAGRALAAAIGVNLPQPPQSPQSHTEPVHCGVSVPGCARGR